MGERFDAGAHLGFTVRAAESVRRMQFLLMITCGLVLLFVLRLAPVKGHATELDYLTTVKSEIDELNGEQHAYKELMERDNEGAYAEPANDLELDKRAKLADLYCTVKAGEEGCQERTISDLEDERLDQDAILRVFRDRLKELQARGTGLRVPLLEEVIEVELVPPVFTALIIALLCALNVAEANLTGMMRLYLEEADAAGASEMATRLLMMSMPGAGLLTPDRRLTTRLRIAILALHAIPVAVIVALLWRHRYLFYDSAGTGGALNVAAACAYSLATILVAILSLRAAVQLFALLAARPPAIRREVATT
jgi:hypothetical protein